jgi:hypothetical protein
LKSVEEDITVSQGETNNQEDDKEYITIVKTTKVTTKIKQVEPQSKSKNNKKNKKKNKSKKRGSIDSNEEVVVSSQQQATVEKTDRMSSSKVMPVATKKVESSKGTDDVSSEGTSNPSPNESNENLACGEQRQQTVFEVDIMKSTEESVFQNSPEKSKSFSAAVLQRPRSDVLVTSLTEDTATHLDLNSTQLDCEEILSNYEMTSSTTNHVTAEHTNGFTNGHSEVYTNGHAEPKQNTTATVAEVTVSLSPSSKRKIEEAKQSSAPKKQPRTDLNTNIYAIANLQKGNSSNLLFCFRDV